MLDESAKIIKSVAEQNGGTSFEYAATEEEGEKLWEARKNAFWAALAMYPGAKVILTDVWYVTAETNAQSIDPFHVDLSSSVPMSRLPDLINDVTKDFEAMGLSAPVIGHVGDGNFHSCFAYYNEEERVKAESANNKLVQRALALDGTCMCFDWDCQYPERRAH